MDASRPISRRSFVAGGAALGGALLLRRPLPRAAARRQSPADPRVAVIGAGLAGLSCAYRLHRGGIDATVYEANPERIGGRCWTARGFRDGQVAEHGGEFIDTSHVHIRRLARELGLKLEDGHHPTRSQRRLSTRYFFKGSRRSPQEVLAGYYLLTQRAAADARRIGDYLDDVSGRAARALDEMTARDWLGEAAPGADHELLRLATAQYMAEEYGLDVGDLSAINMVVEFGPRGHGSDERFHVNGGNDQIPYSLEERLAPGSVLRGVPLRSLRRRGDGSYALGLAGRTESVADAVVLCLPFTALRRVDLRGAGLSRRKRSCIAELGMGTNAKVLIQFERRFGHYDRWDGEYHDGRIDTWDSSLTERGRSGLLTVYSGGSVGAGYPGKAAHHEAPRGVVRRTLGDIERAVPGLARGFNGRAWLDVWARDPYAHGSYAAFKPGQYTRFWGITGRAEGNLHFGGEHTSTVAQGYLEGAVESGERCAREVLAKFGRGRAPNSARSAGLSRSQRGSVEARVLGHPRDQRVLTALAREHV